MPESSGTPIELESIQFEPLNVKGEKIILPSLTKDQIDSMDPLIPPTSGIRLKILDGEGDQFTCPASKYCLFLRLFKAMSSILVEKLKRPAKVLVTSDERPTSDRLVAHALQILAADKHELFVQNETTATFPLDQFSHSGMSTPYSSATIAIVPGLDAVIVVTASHNSAVWNGIKFYYKLPIPIAGDLMKEISKKALALKEIPLKKTGAVMLKGEDLETRINAYVHDVIAEIIPIESINGEPIVLWPYMGKAKEASDLLESFGANVIKIEKTMEPPDPTVNLPLEEIEGHIDANNAKVAIMVDADRDRIVFIIKTGDGSFLQLNPNELYTAMHNILIATFGKTIINVRTVPSDPRCDDKAACTIETGVGYKHLGMVQYVSCGIDVDKSQFDSALIYGKTNEGRVKIDDPAKLIGFLDEHLPRTSETMLMVLWEESGGHTVNVVVPQFAENGFERFEPRFPLIGDKFPSPAIVVLAELIARGNNLVDAIDTSITGIRVEIEADDQRKQAIMKALEQQVGQQIPIGENDYEIIDYRDNQDLLDIICFSGARSRLYARPSGTGNSVRIYLFGDRETGKAELDTVADYIKNLE